MPSGSAADDGRHETGAGAKVRYVYAGGRSSGVSMSIDSKNGPSNIMGWRPMQEIPTWIAAADVSYVGLTDDIHSRFSFPSKIQATAAMERPVLTSVPGDVSQVVERDREHGCLLVREVDVIVVAGDGAAALAVQALIGGGAFALKRS